MTNERYKILSSKITDGHEIEIEIECSSSSVQKFNMIVFVPYNISYTEIFNRLNTAAYHEIIAVPKKQQANQQLTQERLAKIQNCNNIKHQVDQELNKFIDVTTPL